MLKNFYLNKSLYILRYKQMKTLILFPGICSDHLIAACVSGNEVILLLTTHKAM